MKYKLRSFYTQLSVSRIANVNYFEYGKEHHITNDSHNFCELMYIYGGTGMLHSENYSGKVVSDQLIIHRPNERHSFWCTENTSPNIVMIGFECNCDELVPFAQKPISLLAEHKGMLADVMKEAMNVYEPPYNATKTEMIKRKKVVFGADQMIKNRLEAFLITIIRDFNKKLVVEEQENSEEKVLNIHRYILEHYKEKIQLEDLCFLFGTNKTTLCKNFKKMFGMTVTNYVNMLKEKEARRLLDQRHLSITEVSGELGFSSIHYFCRFFKEATGMTPKEYMRRNKEKKTC